MKKGLVLILVGHINFILAAIVHGSVLRHISKPSQHISTQYTVANIISVTSGLLVGYCVRHFVFKPAEETDALKCSYQGLCNSCVTCSMCLTSYFHLMAFKTILAKCSHSNLRTHGVWLATLFLFFDKPSLLLCLVSIFFLCPGPSLCYSISLLCSWLSLLSRQLRGITHQPHFL